ncbi:MAG: hypothetical protein QXS74_06335 [Nitrososphaeria archaeon]
MKTKYIHAKDSKSINFKNLPYNGGEDRMGNYRITKKDLLDLLMELNMVSTKKYDINQSYGTYNLVYFCNGENSKDGVRYVYGNLSAREMFHALRLLLLYKQAEGI